VAAVQKYAVGAALLWMIGTSRLSLCNSWARSRVEQQLVSRMCRGGLSYRGCCADEKGGSGLDCLVERRNWCKRIRREA
jgi:hypothetical protein